MSKIKVTSLLFIFPVFLAEFSTAQPVNLKSGNLNFSFKLPEIEKKPTIKKIDFGVGISFSSHLKDNSSSTDYSDNTLYYSAESPSVGHNFSGNFTFVVLGRYFLTPNFAVGLMYSYQSLDESESIFQLEGLSPDGELKLTGKGFFINFFPGIQFIKGSRTSIKAGLIYKSYSGSGTFPTYQVTYKDQVVNSYNYTFKPGFAPFLSGGFEFALTPIVTANLEVFGEFASTGFKTLKIDRFDIDSFGNNVISDNQIGVRFSVSGGFEL